MMERSSGLQERGGRKRWPIGGLMSRWTGNCRYQMIPLAGDVIVCTCVDGNSVLMALSRMRDPVGFIELALRSLS